MPCGLLTRRFPRRSCVHLEGTITPRLAPELAHRNAKAIPSALVDGETAYRWSSASQFFEAYDAAASCLASAGDYADRLPLPVRARRRRCDLC